MPALGLAAVHDPKAHRGAGRSPTPTGTPAPLQDGWRMGLQVLLRSSDDYERLHVQVTVPVKIRSIKNGGFESHVAYNITIEGKTYTMNLTQKVFLPHNFKVYGYDGAGIMKPLDKDFQNFCYYQGFVEGYPNSMVMVSACTGLRGLLQFENATYGIEPLESSVGFEHVIYQVKYKNETVSLYTEKDIEIKNLPYKIQSVEPQEMAQYLEMHIIVEKHLYDHMGSDTTVVTQKIFQLIGLTNAIFTSFNLTIILSSLELWVDENKMSTAGDANELLHRFLRWKRSYLVLRPHDVAFLLVYRERTDFVGATFQGKMCERDYGGGVAMHPKAVGLESLAIILAQLVSLNMGISYDDVKKCHCPGTICIMNPEAIHSSGVKIFSNCSMEDFAHFISKQKSECLQNHPRLEPSYKQAAVCGNKVVEQGEACDCGTEQCAANKPVCCEHSTCSLTADSECASGPCCSECKFSKKGHVCRSAANECDLTEYCNGSSQVCQENVFIIDGHPCSENKWICIGGVCRSGDKQCEDLFGQGSIFASEDCYNELNSKTDISGNCGITDDGYKACEAKDRKCGKLICKYGGSHILQLKDATAIYANITGDICVSLEYNKGHAEIKNMWVKDGTVCGAKKVCKEKECVDNSYLNYDCTPETCNNQGVCNNKRNCHCNADFVPPQCQEEKEGSGGGSIDSGNHENTAAATERRFIERTYYESRTSRWPFFLVIPFFVILCVLIGMLVKVHFQRKKWKSEDYTSDEQLESETESKE
ncbi:disintegrin and metalloproteinase domain-containing protein 2 [Marmota marmota marmota]|uniref:disintegrin and metalloproteinase domain-containing protein 2 n=1 Tax=Marmota marmota marmota TaxID=9994 RepID=UPI002091F2CE|nr:disintegrin and metalloproteinase domain-containing protein 2 [Marmota marmota marmota]